MRKSCGGVHGRMMRLIRAISKLGTPIPLNAALLAVSAIVVARVLAFVPWILLRQLLTDLTSIRGQDWVRHLIELLIGILGVSWAQGAIGLLISRFAQTAVQRWATELRISVFEKLMRLPLDTLAARHSSIWLTHFLTDVELLRSVIGVELFSLLGGMVTAAGALLMIVWISPTLGAAQVVCLAGIISISKSNVPNVRVKSENQRRLFSLLAEYATEAISGVRIVKIFNAYKRIGDQVSQASEEMRDGHDQIQLEYAKFSLTSSLATGGSMAVLLGVGGWMLRVHSLAGPDLLLAVLCWTIATSPITQIVDLWRKLDESAEKIEGLASLLGEREEVPTSSSIGISGAIKLERVSYYYRDRHSGIENVDITLSPGKVTAVVGPSGAGKTTLVNIICGLISPHSGLHTVGSVVVDLSNQLKYRERVGLAQQDAFLFNTSIGDNISLARTGISEEEIRAAARLGLVDELFADMPAGFSTEVGERGACLSAGQKQRISIARAVAKDPAIFVLDEAMANLDTISEKRLYSSLEAFMRERITILVSHRLSAITWVDNIVVLRDGRIVESGTHKELIGLNGLYARLFRLQDVSNSVIT